MDIAPLERDQLIAALRLLPESATSLTIAWSVHDVDEPGDFRDVVFRTRRITIDNEVIEELPDHLEAFWLRGLPMGAPGRRASAAPSC